jgi:hypothetical protein
MKFQINDEVVLTEPINVHTSGSQPTSRFAKLKKGAVGTVCIMPSMFKFPGSDQYVAVEFCTSSFVQAEEYLQTYVHEDKLELVAKVNCLGKLRADLEELLPARAFRIEEHADGSVAVSFYDFHGVTFVDTEEEELVVRAYILCKAEELLQHMLYVVCWGISNNGHFTNTFKKDEDDSACHICGCPRNLPGKAICSAPHGRLITYKG